MANQRKTLLDSLERRLTGPRRIALFGHRAVGKTTLLAMFYREASTGRVPGLRMAAKGASTAEYLADTIARIESGEPPPGTLAETELQLRLYHGLARFELIVKDYQGEHVSLGSDAPIREFFADCDAVLLCLDPEGSAAPADRRRRQQEIEDLLERFIERSDDGTAGRPVALLVTKYDQVLAAGGPPPDRVEELVDSLYGMTRHALAQHAPRGAIFAVSSYGREGEDGRPPAELHPLGLEGPLGWLAEQLEVGDREQLEWLWELVPDDVSRLSRCVRAYEKRYPRSDYGIDFRRRLNTLKRRRTRRNVMRAVVAAGMLVAAAAGYDAWAFQQALAFERDNPAPAVERRWSEFVAWHPSQRYFWPSQAKVARHKLAEWRVKAAGHRLAVGTAGSELSAELIRLKDEAPDLVPDIRRVEQARDQQRHEDRWHAIEVADLVAGERPEDGAATVRSFLRDYPQSPHKADATKLLGALEGRLSDRRDQQERHTVDALARAASLPDADLHQVIEQEKDFLDAHPDSRWRADVEALLAETTRRLDEADIAKARQYSKQYPTNFAIRARRYQDYLKAHQAGGKYISEAMEAINRIDRERDVYTYRLAFDHYTAHPDDVAEVARRLRSYLDANASGRFTKDAHDFLAWWDKVTVTNDYHVVLKRGEVESDVGKYLAGGAPDLGVELWVGGTKYGPSPIVPNSRTPNWNYAFSRPIKWKLGDPVVIRILDFDWSSAGTGVYRLTSAKGDPLAIRMLSGDVRPSKGGRTHLVFTSDFKLPKLTRPD
jgi:GTPase SAR1 family protein